MSEISKKNTLFLAHLASVYKIAALNPGQMASESSSAVIPYCNLNECKNV